MPSFVHLHCHTEYSLLDGAIRIRELCRRAAEFGMGAAAITDHGYLHGAIPFYKEAKKAGIKPIIGCEVYVCRDRKDKAAENGRDSFHLVLLARNRAGYHNLVKLVTLGDLEGFYYTPRVDKELLRRYSGGLTALSACLGGEIPRALLSRGVEAARALCAEYQEIFPEHFFLELQCNGLPEQEEANRKLLELSRLTGLPLVATNDCHYLDSGDAEAHDALLCIQTKKALDDPDRMRLPRGLYYKSAAEMERGFAFAPEALVNTGRIADMCEDYAFTLKGVHHFPRYVPADGGSLDEEFRRLSREGLAARLIGLPYAYDAEEYRQRLEMELDVIGNMSYQGYFLVVQDFINWAKARGVPVGPGRGSAAGSLVAWALRITNVDPIPYKLFFERFLNPERVSLPDIDVDFCERRRPEVLQYVNERYGADAVAQITTFGTLKTRAVLKDVGRVLGVSYAAADGLVKLVGEAELLYRRMSDEEQKELKKRLYPELSEEELKEKGMTLDLAMELAPALGGLYASDAGMKKLMDMARRLEGLPRHASTHASAVVISDQPMVEYLPLYRGKNEEVVTQYDMKVVESVGLVKFDFLGLRNMTMIQDTLELIRAQGREAPDMDALPLDDAAAFRLYAAGDTDGIFQMESPGMRQYLRKLKPTVLEDIVAMVALYRPGPLEGKMVDYFINCKHGLAKVSYPLPSLESCLKDTYGAIVYQEQVMQIARIVAGYTLGGADELRRAMGKKDQALMESERGKFMAGALANGISEAKAEDIFDLISKFARYGFNKSHSVAYALISYQTAYLKAHYAPEFMASLLTSEAGNQDKLLKYVAACKDMGLRVEPPSVQESLATFSVREGRILFGLNGIKNVGIEAVHEIIEARRQGGPFKSLLDLCCRVNLRKVTKRVLEHLIKAGAVDCLGATRQGLFSALDLAVSRAQRRQKSEQSAQASMLGLLPEDKTADAPGGVGVDCPEQSLAEWPEMEKLRFEKESLGFFLSSHPLHSYRRCLRRLGLITLEEARALAPGSVFKTAALLSGIENKVTKAGKPMAVCRVSDLSGGGECLFFPKKYAKLRPLLLEDTPLELTATVQEDRLGGDNAAWLEEGEEEASPRELRLRELRLTGEELRPLGEALENCSLPWEAECGLDELSLEALDGLEELLRRHAARRGGVELRLLLRGQGGQYRLRLPGRLLQPGLPLDEDLLRWEEAARATAL